MLRPEFGVYWGPRVVYMKNLWGRKWHVNSSTVREQRLGALSRIILEPFHGESKIYSLKALLHYLSKSESPSNMILKKKVMKCD